MISNPTAVIHNCAVTGCVLVSISSSLFNWSRVGTRAWPESLVDLTQSVRVDVISILFVCAHLSSHTVI